MASLDVIRCDGAAVLGMYTKSVQQSVNVDACVVDTVVDTDAVVRRSNQTQLIT